MGRGQNYGGSNSTLTIRLFGGAVRLPSLTALCRGLQRKAVPSGREAAREIVSRQTAD